MIQDRVPNKVTTRCTSPVETSGRCYIVDFSTDGYVDGEEGVQAVMLGQGVQSNIATLKRFVDVWLGSRRLGGPQVRHEERCQEHHY
jgi:hypothetical protein